jgi:Rps23 Pro-64 3,4-dihydroxylase Tpa1-like proline 4-hydroxylase
MWRMDHLDASAAHWHADPFRDVAFDDVLDEEAVRELMTVLDDEPVEHYASDIFAFDATAPEPTTEAFRVLRSEFAAALAPMLSAASGRSVSRVDMRAFAYRTGHYLLPHTDHQEGLGRVLAYIFYLPTPDAPVGGELELYRCAAEGGELVTINSAKLVEPRPNRLVVFEVSELSLHQVREVMSGLRLSLAGWFYA